MAICYEVAFDDLVGDSVRTGAQIITVPSNNATFGRSDMTYQQLAMSQVRAVEHGRTILVAAISGSARSSTRKDMSSHRPVCSPPRPSVTGSCCAAT